MKRLCIYLVVLFIAGLLPATAAALPTYTKILDAAGSNPFTGEAHWTVDFQSESTGLYQDNSNPTFDRNPYDFTLYDQGANPTPHSISVEGSNARTPTGNPFSGGFFTVDSDGGDRFLDNDYFGYYVETLDFEFNAPHAMGFSFDASFTDTSGVDHSGATWQMTAYTSTLDGSQTDNLSFYLNFSDTLNGGSDAAVYGLRLDEQYRANWKFTGFKLNLVNYSLDINDDNYGYYIRVDDIRLTPVPAAVWLLGSGLLGLIGLRKRIGF